ncbi:unnamed protein product [Urochloa decumbens]|uniref:Uncharacterized protein n=1 Tax=Urochloa decumbens TaxID=240449 RepID=A0ABC8WA49_9POAL
MASSKQSLALLLAVLAAAAAAPASAAGGVPACATSCSPRASCSAAARTCPSRSARGRGGSPRPAELRLGGAAWYSATFIQLEPVTVAPHADPARGGGRLLGHCPAVGCGAGHGRCARETAAGSDCRNVDELKIIYFDHRQ